MGFTIVGKVVTDHASDAVIRRSRTGSIVHLDSAPVYWHSKKQNSDENSSFSSEFIAMNKLCERIQGLAYELRMMGITYEGPPYVYGDNQSVLSNSTTLDSTSKKKYSSLAYHLIREGEAMDDCRTAHANDYDNEADLFTKVLPLDENRRKFVRKALVHIYG